MSVSWPRLLFSGLSAGRRRTPLSIFIFHRVLAERNPLFPSEPTAAEFDEIVAWIKEWLHILPLGEASKRLMEGRLPARAACITFDDGYADNFETALPILIRHQAPATFFIATGFLNGGRMWNDTVIEAIRNTEKHSLDLEKLGLGEICVGTVNEKRTALHRLIPALKHRSAVERANAVTAVAEASGVTAFPNNLMMTDDQVRGLHATGMSIGAHTVSHPILARCDGRTARDEIAASREQLEGLVGQRVTLFAYPNGKLGKDYTDEHVEIVRELGFEAAVSTNPGASRHGDDHLQLRRFTPWERQRTRFAIRVAQNLLGPAR